MRQVPRYAGRPVHHLLIGSGRISRHFERYFSLLEIPFTVWKKPRELSRDLLRGVVPTHVWFLVSDSAILSVARDFEELFRELASGEDVLRLHASGASVIAEVRGVHPLMTFGPSVYELADYQRFPFVIEHLHDGLSAATVLGGLPNVAVLLDAEKKPLYHALVSMSANFPSLLWAEVFQKFESDLGLPRDLLAPLLFQSLANVLRSGSAAVTGPLVRGDHLTVRNHKSALEGTAFVPLYEAFENFFTEPGVGNV